DIPEFTSFLKRIYKYVDITKPSLDDCARIFSSELEPSEYAQLFIQWGAKIVIISMGADGCLLATAEGEEYLLFANPVSVVDVTGAGDAYWAGFLTALLADKPPLEAARQGQAIAELKIKTLGPLTQLPGSEMLEKMIASVRYKKKPVVVKK
ncbi:MAG: carbohydrate kinase family protein, partial [Chloroflexota bacterium]|nr:carbohydrate kinase family protein [Chloroflexota bacterium]